MIPCDQGRSKTCAWPLYMNPWWSACALSSKWPCPSYPTPEGVANCDRTVSLCSLAPFARHPCHRRSAAVPVRRQQCAAVVLLQLYSCCSRHEKCPPAAEAQQACCAPVDPAQAVQSLSEYSYEYDCTGGIVCLCPTTGRSSTTGTGRYRSTTGTGMIDDRLVPVPYWYMHR